eukprot:2155436-Rhodomonas_salina.2
MDNLKDATDKRELEEESAKMEEGCLFCGEGFKTGAAEMLCKHGQSTCWKSRSSGVLVVILKAVGAEVDGEGKVSFSKKASKECLKSTHPVYAVDGVTCPVRAFTMPMRPAVAPGSALGEWLESKEGSDTEGDSEQEAEDRE